MKKIILIAVMFVISCAPVPKPQDDIYPNHTKTNSGYSFTGNGSNWNGNRAQNLAESDMFSKFAFFLGETITVRSTLQERETVGLRASVNRTSSVHSYAQIKLPPEVRIENNCQYIKEGGRRDAYCTATIMVPFLTMHEYQEKRREKAEKEKNRVEQSEKQRAQIVDALHQYSVKDKLNTLEVYSSTREYRLAPFNHSTLALSFGSQLSLSEGVTVTIDGPESIDLLVALNDVNGCVDGFKASMLLPSGRTIKSISYGCNKLSFLLPRPVLAGTYILPVIIEYKGMFLGPLDLRITAKGDTLRLTSGLFHAQIQAIGVVEGEGISAKAYAISKAYNQWNEKLVVIGKSNIENHKTTIVKIVNGTNFTEVKIMGHL